MSIKKILFTVWILFIATATKADTFVVTSNANSGSGTLREAILGAAANGISTNDIIVFNILDQSVAGRTIDILTELPFLTSNLIIDGTTQPGSAIGTSDARIIIQHSIKVSDFHSMTVRNTSNVEIYGLFFYQAFTNFFFGGNFAIYFRKCDNLIIGKPGKGNYFLGGTTAIGNWINNIAENYTSADTCNTVTIQSNIIGLDNTGKVAADDYAPRNGINIRNVRNALIGGFQPQEGNYIYSDNAVTYLSDAVSGNGTLKILGNFIGVNSKGIVDLDGSSDTNPGQILVSGNQSDTKVDIKKNTIGGTIYVTELNSDVFIQANKITTTNLINSPTGDGNYYSNASITAYAGLNRIMIGGNDPSDGNDITLYNAATLSNGLTGHMAIATSTRANAGGVEIKNNVIHCNTGESSSILNGSQGLPYQFETNTTALWVLIDSTGNGFVRGRASKNCRIDVYLDDECRGCEGKQMIGSTMSDANGKWSFTGNFNAVVVATATDKYGHTFGFTTPSIVSTQAKTQQPTCGKSNGYIKGLIMIGGDNCEWRYSADVNFQNSVYYASTLDIENVKPGYYWIMAKLGGTCYGWKARFDFKDNTPKINTQPVQLTNPSCGQFNGQIMNMSVSPADYCRFEWRTTAGFVMSLQKNLTNAGPGTYKFFAIDTAGGGCIDSSAIYTLVNQSGPTVDISNIQITEASCDLSNGSIKNILVQNTIGAVFFKWEDSLKNTVGNKIDLLNIKSGKYRLKFKDMGSCDTITTPYFSIANKGGISIDDKNKIVRASGCSLSNGSIKGIIITGGEITEWINISNNAIVANTADAFNLSAGTYGLLVKNNTCELTLPAITISNSSFIPITVTGSKITDASCDLPNGGVTQITFNKDTSTYSFSWTNTLTQIIVASTSILTNINGGSFSLFATDSNGCKQTIFNAVVLQRPKPSFDSSALQVKNDQCNQFIGAIKQMKVKNLVGPTTYQWLDSNGKVAGNKQDLELINTNYYRLQVTDDGTCTITSNPIFIKDSFIVQPLPLYNDTIIARNTPAYLTVKNFFSGTYFLFNNSNTPSYIDSNTTGSFNTLSLTTDCLFYIQYRKGSCVSEKKEISVKVTDKTTVVVPNVFSPNGDGVNDVLKINFTGFFTLTEWTIFNRSGQKVFLTKDASKAWDGRYNGSILPVATYYYILLGYDIFHTPISMQGSILLLK